MWVGLAYTSKGRADKQPLCLEAVSVVEKKCLVWTQLYRCNAKNEVTPGFKAPENHYKTSPDFGLHCNLFSSDSVVSKSLNWHLGNGVGFLFLTQITYKTLDQLQCSTVKDKTVFSSAYIAILEY